tara:strand:+ start:457 stop:768 length:312 start_codon:yes stop_codon:yes gene_type:complete
LLNDREKMVLHFCCTVTIAKLTGIPHRDVIIEQIIESIRKNRCRSLSDGEISNLLEDINEEMVSGGQMFGYLIDESKHLTDEEIWSMTGERPNRKMNGVEKWR